MDDEKPASCAEWINPIERSGVIGVSLDDRPLFLMSEVHARALIAPFPLPGR